MFFSFEKEERLSVGHKIVLALVFQAKIETKEVNLDNRYNSRTNRGYIRLLGSLFCCILSYYFVKKAIWAFTFVILDENKQQKNDVKKYNGQIKKN